MKLPVYCSRERCGAEIGYEISYPWGDYGQSPPDIFLDDENLVDDQGRAYCSVECMEENDGGY